MSSMAAPLPASRVTDAPSDFAGQVVLVTGGTRGIGRAIAAAFLEHGATVVICGRNPPAEPVEAAGARAEFLAADIRDPAQVDALIDAVAARHGRLDVLTNNAGGSPAADPATASPRFSEAIVRLNLLAPLFAAQAAYRLMHNQKTGGVIINIASIAATRPSPTVAAYGASKAGLLNRAPDGVNQHCDDFVIWGFSDLVISNHQITKSPNHQIEEWCRCRDLNPGQRGYEPRALTN